jgi:hypothetical protein
VLFAGVGAHDKRSSYTPRSGGRRAAPRRICEPGGVLDRLRWVFPFVVALLFPLAGAILAAARFVEGNGYEGRQLAGVTLLGASLYALFFFG